MASTQHYSPPLNAATSGTYWITFAKSWPETVPPLTLEMVANGASNVPCSRMVCRVIVDTAGSYTFHRMTDASMSSDVPPVTVQLPDGGEAALTLMTMVSELVQRSDNGRDS